MEQTYSVYIYVGEQMVVTRVVIPSVARPDDNFVLATLSALLPPSPRDHRNNIFHDASTAIIPETRPPRRRGQFVNFWLTILVIVLVISLLSHLERVRRRSIQDGEYPVTPFTRFSSVRIAAGPGRTGERIRSDPSPPSRPSESADVVFRLRSRLETGRGHPVNKRTTLERHFFFEHAVEIL